MVSDVIVTGVSDVIVELVLLSVGVIDKHNLLLFSLLLPLCDVCNIFSPARLFKELESGVSLIGNGGSDGGGNEVKSGHGISLRLVESSSNCPPSRKYPKSISGILSLSSVMVPIYSVDVVVVEERFLELVLKFSAENSH